MNNNIAFNANHAARLIEFASTLTPAAIPHAAYANAKRCLLDALGCGLFGASQPWSVLMAAQMFAEKSQGASSVFGHAAPLAACAAALCNGTAIHGFELDDLLPAAIIHPGTVIIPAVLAAAENAGEKMPSAANNCCVPLSSVTKSLRASALRWARRLRTTAFTKPVWWGRSPRPLPPGAYWD